jgi:hypothetical protein
MSGTRSTSIVLPLVQALPGDELLTKLEALWSDRKLPDVQLLHVMAAVEALAAGIAFGDDRSERSSQLRRVCAGTPSILATAPML